MLYAIIRPAKNRIICQDQEGLTLHILPKERFFPAKQHADVCQIVGFRFKRSRLDWNGRILENYGRLQKLAGEKGRQCAPLPPSFQAFQEGLSDEDRHREHVEVHVREADDIEKGALEVIPEAQGFAEARKLLYLQVFDRHMGFGEWQR